MPMDQYLFTAACILSTGIWVAVGLYKISHQEKMIEVIRAHNIPFPLMAFWLSILVELGGAALMITQTWIWLAVTVWIGFLLVATPIFHGRVLNGGKVDYSQLVQFAKNISIAGGLIALLTLSFHESGVPGP